MEKDTIELIMACIGGINLIVSLIVNVKVADLKTMMYEKFLSKEDFRDWTRANSQVVNFKGGKS